MSFLSLSVQRPLGRPPWVFRRTQRQSVAPLPSREPALRPVAAASRDERQPREQREPRQWAERQPREQREQRSGAERQPRERQGGERPGAERQPREWQGGERSGAERQPRERQGGERPGAERQPRERQGGERSGAERQGGERPGAERQPRERQGGERPRREQPHERPPRQQRPPGQRQPPGQQRPRQQQVGEDIPVVRPGQSNAATFFSGERWAQLGASEAVVAALAALGIVRPSHIQAAAFKAIIAPGGRHVVLADHAGSGKTLAYLLPLLQALKEEEALLGAAATQPRCPRLVVVVPTAELCAQVLRVCRALSRTGGLRFRSAAATGGHSLRTQRETLENGVDVLVGTPGRLAELLADGCLRLDFCRAAVCDEVDVLLGEDFAFAEQVRPLRDAAPPSTRWVFATATLPEQVFMDLEEEFPGLVAALGPGLHRTAPGITEQLVDCSGGDEVSEESGFRRKAAALFAVLQEQRAQRAIVFCNKIDTCRKVENFLNRALSKDEGVEVLAHHAAIADGQREANLRRFLATPAPAGGRGDRRRAGSDRDGGSGSSGDSAERLVLVCTDRASRGVDSAFVEHVVLFDLPRDPSEYLRRVGRTTRGAAGTGVVSVLALGRQVKLAKEIIDRNQGGLALHRVPVALPVMVQEQAQAQGDDAERLRADLAAAAAARAEGSGPQEQQQEVQAEQHQEGPEQQHPAAPVAEAQ